MAIANFFEKASVAASQALRGLDYDDLVNLLEQRIVGIAFDEQACTTVEGWWTTELLANLLARFYPRLSFFPQDSSAAMRIGELIELALAINPKIEIVESEVEPDAVAVVGSRATSLKCPQIYVGSKNWTVSVSSFRPVGSSTFANPFSAGAAACFGAANIFRTIFSDKLGLADNAESFELSLRTFKFESDNSLNLPSSSVAIEECFLVGNGAIGNGAVWSLSKFPEFHGQLHLIDDESIDLSNLQRYVLATQSDVGVYKVDLAKKQFRPDSAVYPNQCDWSEFLDRRNDWSLNTVLTAVDTREDRIAIQASVPRLILNAWTQTGDLGISRHRFTGKDGCLACLYFPVEGEKNLDQQIAEAIGLPNQLMEIRTLLYSGKSIGRDLLFRAATAMRVPPEDLLPFENEPLVKFYSSAICGGLVLRLGGALHDSNRELDVPLAFQSALAGILLAAELVMDSVADLSEERTTTTRIDLLRPTKGTVVLNYPVAKSARGNCICQDADFIAAYNSKFG
jgi:hypothetical protein